MEVQFTISYHHRQLGLLLRDFVACCFCGWELDPLEKNHMISRLKDDGSVGDQMQ